MRIEGENSGSEWSRAGARARLLVTAPLVLRSVKNTKF